MMGNQKVFGAIPFSSKKEKDWHYGQLRREHGDRVKIRVEDGILIYSYRDLVS